LLNDRVFKVPSPLWAAGEKVRIRQDSKDATKDDPPTLALSREENVRLLSLIRFMS